MKTESLQTLLTDNKELLYNKIRDHLRPTFQGDFEPNRYEKYLKRYLWLGANVSFGKVDAQRGVYLFPKQAETVAAAEEFLEKNKAIILSGETGTGKTYMGIALLSKKEFKRIVILVPPHLVEKWVREIEERLSGKVDYRLKVVQSYKDILPLTKKGKPSGVQKQIYIIPKTTNKLGYRSELCVPTRRHRRKINKGNGVTVKMTVTEALCPRCGYVLTSYPFGEEAVLKRTPTKCYRCGEKLLRPIGKKRISPAEFLARYGKKFDLLINDEIHEEKAKDTLTADAFGKLIPKARRVVGLTGTLLGGYASHAFYTLFRLFPKLFKEEMGYLWEDVERFKEEYGGFEEIYEYKDGKKGRKYGVKERPDLSPRLLDAIMPCAVFLRLDEIKFFENVGLPPYKEVVHYVKISEKMKEPYVEYLTQVLSLYRSAPKENRHLIATIAQQGLLIPDMPRERFVARGRNGNLQQVAIEYKPVDNLVLSNKEHELIQIVSKNLEKKRKVLVYGSFVQKGVLDHLQKILQKVFLAKKISVLTSKVPASKRESWLKRENADILITNPELVKTGLDLLEYPTIIFYQLPYNVFTLRQAARRSWRIGQKEPVEVHTIVYDETAQAVAARLIGGKINISQGIEGRLSSGSDMAAMAEDENIAVALAKELLQGGFASSGSREEVVSEYSNDREWEPFERYYLELLEQFKSDPYALECELSIPEKPEPKKETSRIYDEELIQAFRQGRLF